jgi:hypothetical protein
VHVLPILSKLPFRRWHIISGVGMVLVVLLIAGAFLLRQQQLAAQASAPAGVCAPTASASATAVTVGIIPPGVTLPVMLPTGEPRVVATVNGDPLYAVELELRVAGTRANNRQALQAARQAQPGSLPPNLLATLEKTPNQVRHDALTQMIQECLLLQEGKRLGLSASLPAAQAMARQQVQLIRSAPASDPARVRFETYLQVNHLTEQTYLTDPRVLHGYRDSLTIIAVRQHIRTGLPAGELPESGISAYIQHLWQIGNVRVFLPAQLGW